MTQNRLFTLLISVLGLTVLFLTGCTHTVKLPDLSYDKIRTYKSFKVYANRSSAINTGVYVENGDYYSLIATGYVSTNRWDRAQVGFGGSGPERKLGVMIEKQFQGVPPINATIDAQTKGEISLVVEDSGFIAEYGYAKYNSKEYQDNTGSFEVTIIVWKTKNLDHIVDFFKQFKMMNPEEEVAEKLFAQAQSLKTLLAEVKIALDESKDQPQEQNVKTLSKSDKAESLDHQPPSLTASEPEKQQRVPLQKSPVDSASSRAPKDLYAPLMLIVSPREGQTISTVTIQLIGVVEDDKGLQKVEITINDKPLPSNEYRGIRINPTQLNRRYEFNEKIPVDVGSNLLKIHAEDISGRISEKTIVINRKEMRLKVWAVIVGVDNYPNFPHLKYAVKDARAFYDLLVKTKLVSPDNIFFVSNEKANLSNLRSILGTKLKRNAGQDDMVIIYFAGHGATEKDAKSPDGDGLEKYLLPFDADPKDLYASALPMREISYILNRINSERLIFIADSCYSGASGGRTVSIEGTRANISDSYINRIASGKGRVIMTASAANEVSVEDDTLQHGIFTYYLIEGLKGNADYNSDGLVTVDEVYRYVSEKVSKATAQEQHPVKKGSVEGQLVLGIVN